MTAPPPKADAPPVPPLRDGDRLDRLEFERRYEAMPGVNKAELIEGVVSMPSPVAFESHGEEHAHLMGWLFDYRRRTPGVRVGDNATVRLDMDNEPQPDALLLIDPSRGGRARIVGRYIEGAPELAAEVAASSVSIDRNAKFRAYQRTGVQEYILWRVEDGAIDWFRLRGGQYESLPTVEGVIRGEVFPGLWLDTHALITADLDRLMAVLQQGLASPEHAAFVASLQPPAVP